MFLTFAVLGSLSARILPEEYRMHGPIKKWLCNKLKDGWIVKVDKTESE